MVSAHTFRTMRVTTPDGGARRKSLSERMVEKSELLSERHRKRQAEEERGWQEVDIGAPGVRVTYEAFPFQGSSVGSLLDYSPEASLWSIFSSVYTRDYMQKKLEEMRIEHPGLFVQTRGSARHCTEIVTTVMDLYHVLAFRIMLHAQQKKPSRNEKHANFIERRFAEVRDFFVSVADLEHIRSAQRMRKLSGNFIIKAGTWQETELFSNLCSHFTTFGELFSGDEKLYHADLLKSGMVKVVLSKPARVGVWVYQGVVYTGASLPVTVYVRVHTEISKLDETVKMHEIVNEWGDLILSKASKKEPGAILVCDSHYLTMAGMQDLIEKNVKFIAAVTEPRFEDIASLVSAKVQKSGDMAFVEKPPSVRKQSYLVRVLPFFESSRSNLCLS